MSSVLSAVRNPSRILKKIQNPKTYSIKDDGFKPYVDEKRIKKYQERIEKEKENHPSWTNNPGSEKMAQAGFGGRKRKTRKRRKWRRKTRRKKNKKKRTKKKARGRRRRRRSTKKGKGLFPGKGKKY